MNILSRVVAMCSNVYLVGVHIATSWMQRRLVYWELRLRGSILKVYGMHCPKIKHYQPTSLVGGWTTHLKNMLVKLDHFPKIGMNIKNVWKQPVLLSTSHRFFCELRRSPSSTALVMRRGWTLTTPIRSKKLPTPSGLRTTPWWCGRGRWFFGIWDMRFLVTKNFIEINGGCGKYRSPINFVGNIHVEQVLPMQQHSKK